MLEDPEGHPCLLVLPSDRPATRQEAASVQALLGQMLKEPAASATAACTWRADVLSQLCSEALGVLPEVLRVRGVSSWHWTAPAGEWWGGGLCGAMDRDSTCIGTMCMCRVHVGTGRHTGSWLPDKPVCQASRLP